MARAACHGGECAGSRAPALIARSWLFPHSLSATLIFLISFYDALVPSSDTGPYLTRPTQTVNGAPCAVQTGRLTGVIGRAISGACAALLSSSRTPRDDGRRAAGCRLRVGGGGGVWGRSYGRSLPPDQTKENSEILNSQMVRPAGGKPNPGPPS
ncbi:jg27058 [Pararge aegeria aegeria]|uniref:Jg27058 protein n=1 Tax=Pararge aegeria aegeria TaxID=348720 RepID=A0A8S4S5Z0_9NEOP|nr:jg27058 [Pararge aegeria aegeria]